MTLKALLYNRQPTWHNVTLNIMPFITSFKEWFSLRWAWMYV